MFGNLGDVGKMLQGFEENAQNLKMSLQTRPSLLRVVVG